MVDRPLSIGGREFRSRLLVGTGKYPDQDTAAAALEQSGAEIVTVAVRRVNLDRDAPDSFWNTLSLERYTLLPNTAGCSDAQQAVRTAMLGREVGMGDLVKLEVIGDPDRTLYPDNQATFEAAKVLIAEGFTVLPYVSDDLVLCQRLEQLGCAAVMPLGAPIGSGLGLQNPLQIQLITEAVSIPVIVDAGVGVPSDAALAMELGCDAVLMNTAIAQAREPVRMARAMRLAIEAGREAFLAGRIPKRRYATASSPTDGLLV
ncbi:MAG: thiazole synthase [Deltaproteobacteria bacterium]|nr:thiazole synthase [Deltaproteobacteria bacterium]MCB9786070.1 thiazole synthase [Deltaproteobacteria bacterium]